MNGGMKLLFLLLIIIWWTKQSQTEGPNCTLNTYHHDLLTEDGTEMVKLCFYCLISEPCNISEDATNSISQCLRNITLLSTSDNITDTCSDLLALSLNLCPTDDSSSQSSSSLTTTVQVSSCISQTVETTTIHYTTTVYNPTTVEICPTSSLLLSGHFMTSNTACITSCPVCTPSTTIYQQPPTTLSYAAQTSLLVTCGVLICLLVLALMIVTYCWIRTRRTIKRKGQDPGTNFVYSAQDRFPKSPIVHINNDNTETAVKEFDNPVYDSKTTPALNLESMTETSPKRPLRPSDDLEEQIVLIPALKPIKTKPPKLPSDDNLLHGDEQAATPALNLKPIIKTKPEPTQCSSSNDNSEKPTIKTKPILPRRPNNNISENQTAGDSKPTTKVKPMLPKNPHNTSSQPKDQTATVAENAKLAAKIKPILPRQPNNDNTSDQKETPTKHTKPTKPILPKHLTICSEPDDQTATPGQAENSKPVTKTKPILPRRPNNEDQTATSADSSKPTTKAKPMLPRRPSNGPVYAIPENKERTNGASGEKSGKGALVGVASQSKSKVEEGVKQSVHQRGKETERKVSASRKEREHQYDEPVVAAKGKDSEGRTSASKNKERNHQYDEPNEGKASASKRKEHDHQYDEPNEGRKSTNKRKERDHQYDEPSEGRVTASKNKEHNHQYDEPNEGRKSANKRKEREHQYDKPNEGKVSTNKRKESEHQYDEPNEGIVSTSKKKVREHQYDEPIVAAKGKDNKGIAGANKRKISQHEYDKPVVAAKPKHLQSKKDKGVNSERNEQCQSHILEGLVTRDDKNGKNPDKQEGKADHKYHVLEVPVVREGRKLDEQEEANAYHVLEGPTPRDGKNTAKQDITEENNVYHTLEGPIPRDDSNDRNSNMQMENVYHVLEDPLLRDENQDDENVYHILEGPTPTENET